uniref:Uncharacterized protein n=1 Tax=Romanomermis culicivorax TaxID=13658 RepID=A0A915HU55_ROMCU
MPLNNTGYGLFAPSNSSPTIRHCFNATSLNQIAKSESKKAAPRGENARAINPGSYFCSLLGEHTRRACSELCSEMLGEHSVEQAAHRACSAREYLLVEHVRGMVDFQLIITKVEVLF